MNEQNSRKGVWCIKSFKDPRWDKHGEGLCKDVLTIGGVLYNWIEYASSEFGPQPDDLEIAFEAF